MNKENALLIISQEIFKREIESAEKIFENKSLLKNNLQYHNEAKNKALKSIFDLSTEVLQNVIDDNLKSYFEVPKFLKMNLENFNETFNHNLEILNASKKLLKFIN
jgi:hypothetical protein